MAQKHQAVIDIVAKLDPSVRAQYNQLIDQTEKYRSKLAEVNDRIRIQQKELKHVKLSKQPTEDQKALAKTIRESSRQAALLRVKIAELDKQGIDSDYVKTLRKDYALLRAEIGLNTDKQRELNDEANKLHAEKVRKLEKGIVDSKDEATILKREIADTEKQAKKLADAGANVGERWSSGMRTASTAITAFGAAASAGLYKVTGLALEYNTVLNTTAAITNATTSDLERFNEQARQLGATTEKTASQSAQGQLELARAGFQTNEVLKATPGVLALSTVGALEMGRAAEFTAGTVRAFALDASEANRVSDVFAKATTNSLFTVEGLGTALGTAGAVAHGFGIQFEETIATLSKVRTAGVQASRAGTGLRSFLASLSGLTDDDTNRLQAAGVNIERLHAALKDGSLIQIGRELRGLEPDVLVKVFGTEAAAVAEIVRRDSEAIAEFTTVLENAEGEAQRMRETINTGLVGAFREMKSAAESALLSIGEAGVTKAMTSSADRARDMLRLFDKLPAPIRAVAAGLVLVGPAAVVAGVSMRLLANATQHATLASIKYNAAMSIQNIGLVRLGKALQTATISQYALNTSMLLTPWGAGIAGASALAVALGVLVHWTNRHHRAIKDVFDERGNHLEVEKAARQFNVSQLMAQYAVTEDIYALEQKITQTIQDRNIAMREANTLESHIERIKAESTWLNRLTGAVKGILNWVGVDPSEKGGEGTLFNLSLNELAKKDPSGIIAGIVSKVPAQYRDLRVPDPRTLIHAAGSDIATGIHYASYFRSPQSVLDEAQIDKDFIDRRNDRETQQAYERNRQISDEYYLQRNLQPNGGLGGFGGPTFINQIFEITVQGDLGETAASDIGREVQTAQGLDAATAGR